MEISANSDFLYIDKVSDVELLDNSGSTSIADKICIEGQTYFMKQLRPELQHDNRYRNAFIKEYHTGRNIQSPFVVKYLD